MWYPCIHCFFLRNPLVQSGLCRETVYYDVKSVLTTGFLFCSFVYLTTIGESAEVVYCRGGGGDDLSFPVEKNVMRGLWNNCKPFWRTLIKLSPLLVVPPVTCRSHVKSRCLEIQCLRICKETVMVYLRTVATFSWKDKEYHKNPKSFKTLFGPIFKLGTSQEW